MVPQRAALMLLMGFVVQSLLMRVLQVCFFTHQLWMFLTQKHSEYYVLANPVCGPGVGARSCCSSPGGPSISLGEMLSLPFLSTGT